MEKRIVKNPWKFIYANYEISKAINIGIVGCSDTSIKIGTLFCTNKILANINYASLTTLDRAFEVSEKSSNSQELETLLVDMEAKYFEEISKKHTKNIYIFKVVSDYLELEIPKKSFCY